MNRPRYVVFQRDSEPPPNFEVTLRRTTDGAEVIATHYAKPDQESIDGNLYWWIDGNMGCDCNRRDIVHRALGEPLEPDGNECPDEQIVELVEARIDGKPIDIAEWGYRRGEERLGPY